MLDCPFFTGLILLSIVIGMAASSAGKDGETFTAFFISTAKVILKTITWVTQ